MVDLQFADAGLARLYDLFHPPELREDFGFYLPLVMSADSVLDVGCGTGALLHGARTAGHRGRLCGLDPAEGMLKEARRRRQDVEWMRGDLSALSAARWEAQFDLVVMTGHAFQVLVHDDEVLGSLRAIRRVLADTGRFVFETRNPLAREWESWTSDKVTRVATDQGVVAKRHQIATPVSGDIVHFTTTFEAPRWSHPVVSRSTLRFLDAGSLSAFLTEASLVIEEQFGDWDRQPPTDSSPEIITVARRS